MVWIIAPTTTHLQWLDRKDRKGALCSSVYDINKLILSKGRQLYLHFFDNSIPIYTYDIDA